MRYKSTVANEFNSSPHIAWDRLSLVRQRNFGSSVNEDTQANKLSLSDDCAVKDGENFKILCVSRIRKNGT